VNEHSESAQLDEFAFGTLDAGDAARVSAHLAACAECRREFAEIRAVIDTLPQALPAPPPPRALRGRIMAAIEVPERNRRTLGVLRGLAAALVVAVLGDAALAWRLEQHARVAFVGMPAAAPSPTASTRPPLRTPPFLRAPLPAPASPPTPNATAVARDATVRRLAHDLAAARAKASADRNRIRALEGALALARSTPRIVTIKVAPPPASSPGTTVAQIPSPPPAVSPSASPEGTAAPSVAPSDIALVAALRTGKVYTIDGTVGGEPWHLTIVQPRDGARALVYSGTPDAPSGQTYHTWVIRSGRTVNIGELPAGQPATLEMPMALEPGDVVAFSREPVGAVDEPSSPFLMELRIAP
jgi:anti-sigma factor RsiW